jgi:hypothetical protein
VVGGSLVGGSVLNIESRENGRSMRRTEMGMEMDMARGGAAAPCHHTPPIPRTHTYMYTHTWHSPNRTGRNRTERTPEVVAGHVGEDLGGVLARLEGQRREVVQQERHHVVADDVLGQLLCVLGWVGL